MIRGTYSLHPIRSLDTSPMLNFSSVLEHAAFTCAHAPCSSFCLVAGFSAFGDAASTHRALG